MMGLGKQIRPMNTLELLYLNFGAPKIIDPAGEAYR